MTNKKSVREILEIGTEGYWKRYKNIIFEQDLYRIRIKKKAVTNEKIMAATYEFLNYRERFLKYIKGEGSQYLKKLGFVIIHHLKIGINETTPYAEPIDQTIKKDVDQMITKNNSQY